MSDILSWRLAWLEASPQLWAPLATRLSLRRNLAKIPFPARARSVELQELADEVRALLGTVPLMPSFLCLPLRQLGPLQKELLRERRELTWEDLSEAEETLVVVDERGVLSLTVNGEDHLRFQALLPGLALEEALDEVVRLERGAEGLGYAFDDQWGYLTSRRDDVGLGLRCEVTLHLAALTLTMSLEKVASPLMKEGMTIAPLEKELFPGLRGMESPVPRSGAALYNVSHRPSRGLSEREMAEKVRAFVSTLQDEEARVRDLVKGQQRGEVEDLCWRSYGVLRYARHITAGEAWRFLSAVRLGEELEILPPLGDGIWKALLLGCLPAHVRARGGEEDDGRGRATFLRETMTFRR